MKMNINSKTYENNTLLPNFSRITILVGGFDDCRCVKDFFSGNMEYTLKDCLDIISKSLNANLIAMSGDDISEMRVTVMVETTMSGAIYRKPDGIRCWEWKKIGSFAGYERYSR